MAFFKEKTAPAPVPVEALEQFLTFLLGGEMFAINILSIKEIIEYQPLTEVPLMPDFIRGVMNLRGAVVPVIDLAARFQRPVTEVGRRTCIVILEICHEDRVQDVGIVVDAVSEVIELKASQIEPPPAFGAKVRTDFIQGMFRAETRFVIILNIGSVLSLEEMIMLAESSMEEALAVLAEAAAFPIAGDPPHV